ncbi:hypothetical protein ACIGO7_03945 [Streptomyces virginiae]|uniref:hypothetical protein n=1 Tax=Streptomyces virginiae TaxID=1961 RepID=UPI00344C8A6C
MPVVPSPQSMVVSSGGVPLPSEVVSSTLCAENARALRKRLSCALPVVAALVKVCAPAAGSTTGAPAACPAGLTGSAA